MIELKQIWVELERSKVRNGSYGKWGFTVYRTDRGTNALFKDYIKHLRGAIESKIIPDENAKPSSDHEEIIKSDEKKIKNEDEKKIEAQEKINKRIKMAHQLYVIEDPAIKGFTTAQVRQHHKRKIQEYLNPELLEDEDPQEQLPTPPRSSLPPDNDEDDDGNSEDGEDKKGKKPYSKPPHKPREEKRVGHVWQDYFIHVNDDVLERFRLARWKQEQLTKNAGLYYAADPDETRIAAVVGEAERSDYRLRRFYCETHQLHVPELEMAWQYVETCALAALYDRLSRRPLGQAQLMVDEEEAARLFGSDGVDGAFRGRPVDEFDAMLDAEDHGPWYEMFCFPPGVNSG
ncbi:hypothetical protein PGQ11_005569 [Apiospora arundinis]|uniref:Uncharacterized protein n=1 Tax=Apiospora arundinis TaxID=335852 RepID=A0ABR2JBI4_9PEZI